jgi:transposase
MGTLYLGVDLHVRTQLVCWMNTADGEEHQRELDHQRDDVRGFYAQLPQPAIVGVESCGYAVWFHRLVEETGHQLRVGDARQIRQFAKRRQKNDRRDAALLLELLRTGDFPAVHRPSGASREVLLLLRGRQRLVRMRTALKNGLQAVALSHQLRLGFRLWTQKGQKQFAALNLPEADGLQRTQMQAVLRTVEEQIAAAEEELQRRAAGDARVARLRTHPGVGLLTALGVVHTLEPVGRFSRAREVAAYCGLDPMEHSSGDSVRYGHISKQGNRLLRHTLVEAAMSAARCEEELGRFYRRLRGRRKAHGVAIVAVARKLVLRLYRMLREEKDYQEFRCQGRDADVPGLPGVRQEEPPH